MTAASPHVPGEPPQRRSNNGRNSVSSEISNAVVRTFAEYLGRGPTRARTIITPNLISVVLEDTLTKAERRLADTGEEDWVLQSRRVLQKTMRGDLTSSVESLSGRKVVAFLCDHQIQPDFAVENFVLEPEAPASPS
jgi:uncharacterized protein YbcI